jgi:hypothetical protein
MKKFLQVAMIFLAVAFLHAQEDTSKKSQEQPAKDAVPRMAAIPAYKMNFAVYELENGKRTNERDYIMVVQARERNDGTGSKIKIGTRVPIATGSSGNNTQFTYTDVGFDLDCYVVEMANGKLATRIDMGVSSFAVPEQNTNPGSAGGQPLFRTLTQHLNTVLSPGKPLVVASTDDVNSNKRIQVEVTATKLD